jgi:hypothetical protein
MRLRLEANGQRDLNEGHRGMPKQFFCVQYSLSNKVLAGSNTCRRAKLSSMSGSGPPAPLNLPV